MLCSTLTLVWAKDTNVYITNDLAGREDLNIHYKSGDGDLGQHVLHINQDFKMRFGLTIYGEHSSFCSFQWETVLCCTLMYTTKVGIIICVMNVNSILRKMEHVGLNNNQTTQTFTNVMIETLNVFHFNYGVYKK